MNIEERAKQLLKLMFGEHAIFRDGQLDAIVSVVQKKKTLLVQPTGWGKSIIYFISSKILREKGEGITVIISPLLSLMRNQIENAEKLGINALTINSSNTDDWDSINYKLKQGKCDVLLLSPERLGNKEFLENVFPNIEGGISLFVVDEAHCISDWGHDFRPNYRRIVKILKSLRANVGILATTATANDRVVNDIMLQLGNDLNILRGALARKSLRIQCITLNDQAERLAWLYENINKIEGSGIIYCLTVAACKKVTRYLQGKGIDALGYYADLQTEEKEEREQLLLNNRVKVLVSTIALGMGFDKPDLAFVIHFHRPGSVVEYYQQIGRAGRGIDNAYAILLSGQEDSTIKEYFINNAFPLKETMEKVVEIIEGTDYGIGLYQLLNKINVSMTNLDKCLNLLLIDEVITKENRKYFRTLNPFKYDQEKIDFITNKRLKELEVMESFVDTKSCYMEFISEQLDDPYACACGRCSNCLQTDYFSPQVNSENVMDAIDFLNRSYLVIEPRKKLPNGFKTKFGKNKIEEQYQCEEGRSLCSYGDPGYGILVKEGKYTDEYFSNELVDACYDLIVNNWIGKNSFNWVTSVPSLRRPTLVNDFAKRLANKLGIPYMESIIKLKNNPEQKKMENSLKQYQNVEDAFKITNSKPGTVLLIDDMVDSRWTFTQLGMMLKEEGVEAVYPLALATT
jgi:ATP-dependent DNA helicase RecQ